MPSFHISLAQWSLHRMIFSGELHPLDFPQFSRDTFGINAVEFVNRCFKDHYADDDLSYLPELKSRCDDLGVTPLLYMIDKQGDIGHPDPQQRRQAVENHYKWVEAVKFLGGHSIRVNARSEGTPDEQRSLVVDGLRRLCEFAEPHGINVLVENHGGLSSNGAWLASVMREVNHPRCGTLPDFGNFFLNAEWTEWYDRYQGVAELMPFAKAVSAKSNDFAPARAGSGLPDEEVHTDYRRMMRIVLDAAYRGHVGIEYEGKTLSDVEGVRATQALLECIRDEFEAH